MDTPSATEEVNGKEDIPETQDNSLSLRNLNSRQIEVEELEHEFSPSDNKV